MKNTNFIFLRALRSALLGEKAEIGELAPEQWREILHTARIHKVLPMILESVHDCPGFQTLDEAELVSCRREVRHQVTVQTMRTGEFLSLNRKLQDAGVKALVVKGLICRQLYPKPDQRPSGDEDVLISEEQFSLCCQVMTDFGMGACDGENADAYEIPFRKAGSPLYIELHKKLFPPESDAYGDLNRFFESVFQRAVEVNVAGERVWTMAPTDHLFYLICHAFKHFLHSGFGIRQVCDIILFSNRYGREICWDQVLRNCEAIRAERFAAAIFRIGEKYLTFDPAEASWPASWQELDVDEMPLLSDLLEGGLYGDASLSRKHSCNITLETVAAQKQGKRARGAMTASVFPPAEKIAGKYPYLKKRPWLLPVAWTQRLWNYARETRSVGDSDAAEALKIGNDRLALLRHYGIIR